MALCDERKLYSIHFTAAGFSSDPDRLQVECDLFAEHIDYVEDVCKLISHVAVREADRVRAKHGQVSDSQMERGKQSSVFSFIISGQSPYLRPAGDSGGQHFLYGPYLENCQGDF